MWCRIRNANSLDPIVAFDQGFGDQLIRWALTRMRCFRPKTRLQHSPQGVNLFFIEPVQTNRHGAGSFPPTKRAEDTIPD